MASSQPDPARDDAGPTDRTEAAIDVLPVAFEDDGRTLRYIVSGRGPIIGALPLSSIQSIEWRFDERDAKGTAWGSLELTGPWGTRLMGPVEEADAHTLIDRWRAVLAGGKQA